ncbi:MAG: 30S ribosomal protein S8 [Parcubacteria group bacterium]|nr:30S ribosomal protein S8 [Parcubacteria group bacterium]
MLIRIRNAQAVRKETALVPYSRIKMEIAKLLQQEGFVTHALRKGRKTRKSIEITLAYQENGAPRIHGLRRISKSSRRVYRGVKEMRQVRQGLGTAILSTPKGVLTGISARKEHVGGEVLCEVW